MWWSLLTALLSVHSLVEGITRPVYKIALTQKGFAQSLQYDVETPPLREFTFCTWLRLNDLGHEQYIFTYLTNGDNRVVRLWLDSGGSNIKLSVRAKKGNVESSTPVEFVKDVWRHVCLSYQSDYGAWAMYIDAQLLSCESSQTLRGFILPPGGTVIIGYGAGDNGQMGLEGEVFGVNMILLSTIERNHTIKRNTLYAQKSFPKNKIKAESENNMKYTVLNSLVVPDFYNSYDTITALPTNTRANGSFIRFSTPHSFIDHNVGTKPKATKPTKPVSEEEVLDFSLEPMTADKDKISFWNIINGIENTGKYKMNVKANREPPNLSMLLPTISIFEKPPPPGPSSLYFLDNSLEVDKLPVSKSIYKIKDTNKNVNQNTMTSEISEKETPPPPSGHSKVYGQWTSSKFAGSVLNYLKNSNFYTRDRKKAPKTIPLNKISDSFPYASEFKVNKITPPLQFHRKDVVQKRMDKDQPQKNLQIIEYDWRTGILKAHAQTKPKKVDIVVRGETKKHMDHRFYRNADNYPSSFAEQYSSNEEPTQKNTFTSPSTTNNHEYTSSFDFHNTNSLLSILPFLKSIEYFQEGLKNRHEKAVPNKSTDVKNLTNANKWHNIKSYSNDYTPRRINIQSDSGKKIADATKSHPTLRLKYQPGQSKVVLTNEDDVIMEGRELATAVSNQSNHNTDSISIIKYNHGYLPGHNEKLPGHNEKFLKPNQNSTNINKTYVTVNNFNKHVKIGNALNEQEVIGNNEEQKKRSFVGGDERVPDINRYRSDIDSEDDDVPPSLGPKMCDNFEFEFGTLPLYVQLDGSIDASRILSQEKNKNKGIEFILQNYHKCSWEDSEMGNNSMLLINWSETPVRLFGGAHPKKTIDLCGFF